MPKVDGKTETARELAPPPSAPIEWTAITRCEPHTSKPNGHARETKVTAQTWHSARTLAAIELAVAPEHINCRPWDGEP